jgi:XTP/dITP diphosphohydrolase
MLTIVLTSARVAPGLLSWQAWDALRGAARVLVGSAGHPQVPALAESGVAVEVLADLGAAAEAGDAAALARALAAAVMTDGGPGGRGGPGGAGGPDGENTIWLAPAGADAAAELLGALGDLVGDVQVLPGSRDLPGAHLIDVAATMSTLRASCPWDRKQTHASLAPYLIEESYEALDALEQGDHPALREELGDVLLQVAFHAAIAAERGPGEDGYTIDDIADTLVAKLVRRHPHVFGDVSVGSADEVIRNWDDIKKAERAAKLAAAGADAGSGPGVAGPAGPSVLDGIVLGQPALSLAAQVLRRAGRAGYPAELAGGGPDDDGPDDDGPDDDGPDLGRRLMRLVTRAQQAGLDPEAALRATVRAFMARIRNWERSATLRTDAAIANSAPPGRFYLQLYAL